eukprot:4844652-Pleurochrysis_carterae.AAC.1
MPRISAGSVRDRGSPRECAPRVRCARTAGKAHGLHDKPYSLPRKRADLMAFMRLWWIRRRYSRFAAETFRKWSSLCTYRPPPRPACTLRAPRTQLARILYSS